MPHHGGTRTRRAGVRRPGSCHPRRGRCAGTRSSRALEWTQRAWGKYRKHPLNVLVRERPRDECEGELGAIALSLPGGQQGIADLDAAPGIWRAREAAVANEHAAIGIGAGPANDIPQQPARLGSLARDVPGKPCLRPLVVEWGRPPLRLLNVERRVPVRRTSRLARCDIGRGCNELETRGTDCQHCGVLASLRPDWPAALSLQPAALNVVWPPSMMRTRGAPQ